MASLSADDAERTAPTNHEDEDEKAPLSANDTERAAPTMTRDDDGASMRIDETKDGKVERK